MRSARLLPLPLVVLVVLVGMAPSARAGDGNAVSLGAFAGLHVFAGGSSLGVTGGEQNPNGAKDGWLGGLRASVAFGRWFTAEAELAGLATQDRIQQQKARILGYRISALAPLRSGSFRPFVMVGVGALQVASSDGQAASGLVRDTKAEVHTGIGFDYWLLGAVSLRCDARVLQVPSKASWGLATDVEAMLGASVSFGGWGSSSRRRPAPEVAVTRLPDPPPSLGSANPRAAAEDAVGSSSVQAQAGSSQPVPEKDRAADQGQSAPPTRPSVSSVTDLLRHAPAIRFEPGTTKLTPASLTFLDGLAAALVNEPEARLEIVVHTADNGDAKKDLFFSWRRAQAIKYLLVGKGASVDQLIGTGRGSEKPIAPNLTRTGRMRNERVELHRASSSLHAP